MHVVMLVTNPFPPDPRVLKEANSLVNHGYRTTVICWDRLGKYPRNETFNGIKIHRVRITSSYAAGKKQILYLPRFWEKAFTLIKQISPDVVHCHDLDTTPVGYFYAYKRKIPWIYDAHECYPEQMKKQVGNIIYFFLHRLNKFITPRATITITVNEILAKHLRDYGGNVIVVGNYFPLNKFVTTEHIRRQDLNLKQNDLIVTYIGGFTRERAILPFIKSSEYLPENNHLLIAGDGSQRETLINEIRQHSHTHYLGWVHQTKLPDYYKLSDIIYYGLYAGSKNSIYSTPNSLYLAMTAGKPLIATAGSEIANIVKEEECGIVIDKPISKKIADAIQILNDDSIRQRLGRNGRLAAERKYNWKNAESVLLDAYTHLSKISTP
jgi:glycosyltransferase involved in cell wall biosynthesis